MDIEQIAPPESKGVDNREEVGTIQEDAHTSSKAPAGEVPAYRAADEVVDEMEVDTVLDPPRVLSWGRSDFGCLLHRTEEDIRDGVYSFHHTNRTIVGISSNVYHTAAVTSTGELYTCGQNDQGQVSDCKQEVFERPQVLESVANHRIIAVSCGLSHTVCVTAAGCAISFGGNESGQLGHSASQHSHVPPKVVNFTIAPSRKAAMIITKVACGDLFSLFLLTSGEVFGCGSAAFLGNALKPTNVNQAERVEALVGSNIVDIAAGSAHALALTSTGGLYGWGSNSQYELGFESTAVDKHEQLPVAIPLPSDVGQLIGISAGFRHSIGWTCKGILLGSGSNKHGQLGAGSPRVEAFEQITLPYYCISASCGLNHTLALCFNSKTSIDTSNNESLKGAALVRLHSLKSLETAQGSSCLYGFGSNTVGQLMPSSTVTVIRSPTLISDPSQLWGVSKLLYISAGGDQSFAIGITASNGADGTAGGYLKKQFSTLASKAVLTMSTSALRKLIQRGIEDPSDQQMQISVINTVCEIFSSPSLMAGSFSCDPLSAGSLKCQGMQYDVEGLEACYTSFMSLGVHAVARLLAAVQQTVNELDAALKGQVTLADSTVKVILALWQSPLMANPVISVDILWRLLKLAARQHGLVKEMILTLFPQHLFASRLLKPLQEHLDHHIIAAKGSENVNTITPLVMMCEALRWLHEVNSQAKHVDEQAFYNTGMSTLSDATLVKDYLSWRSHYGPKPADPNASDNAAPQPQPTATNTAGDTSATKMFFFSNYPYLLSAEAKRRILLAESALHQQAATHQAIAQGIMSGTGMIFPYFIIPIERSHLLQEALMHIAHAGPMDMKKPLKVIFIGEEGVDEGGVRKEFFQMLTTQLFDLSYGMFTMSNQGRSLWINMQNTWCIDEFTLVGAMLALALYNGILLDIHLPSVLYKKLLQKDVGLEDLRSLDPELHKGLQQLLQYEPAEQVQQIFCRNFTAEWEEFGAKRTVELIPNGENIPVTGENRALYVEKLVQWILTDSVNEQFRALHKGFSKVIAPGQLLLLTPHELELLMVGTPHLDFKELQDSTEYVGESDWNAQHETIQWFWEVVQQTLSFEEKQKFLQFVTGSYKAPIGGLKMLGLKIQRMGPDSESLPTAHTCFNVLLLPAYSSKDKLQERLIKAIHECEGFGLK